MAEATGKKVDFSKVQAKLENPTRDKTNPHFNSSYVSREKLMEAILPVLNEAGLSLSQGTWKVDGEREMWTLITNDNGFFRFNSVPLVVDGGGPQKMGSGETYASRYGVELLLGIGGTEDDDGEAAEKEDHGKPKTDTAPPLVDKDNPFLPPEEVIKIREAWDRNEALDKKRALPDYQADITEMLWKINNGDVERAATMLFNYSSFQPEGGEVVPGKRDITKFSFKWAKSTCHKLEKEYEKYEEDNPGVTPDEVDAFFAKGGEVP